MTAGGGDDFRKVGIDASGTVAVCAGALLAVRALVSRRP